MTAINSRWTHWPHRLIHKILLLTLSYLPTEQLQAFLVSAATQRTRSLQPAEALCFLFKLDAALYPVKGQLAVAYGNGIHTKHRHMKYHDFFVSRISSGERVLDIGCGIGALAYDITVNANAQVVGIDLNPKHIEQARRDHAHPQIEYYVGDALVDLPQAKFDVVVLSNVLEHLPNRPTFLQTVQSRLQPSRILIRVPLFERDWQVPLKQELGIEWRLDVTHETEYTLESFAAEIAEAKLKVNNQEVRWSEIWAEVISNDA